MVERSHATAPVLSLCSGRSLYRLSAPRHHAIRCASRRKSVRIGRCSTSDIDA
ncbi:hypothetical protein L083_6985 [Actinoplanes sp. N902-109]|nr:hypothetical protein L083_6985 [Actinoplanes sp. N902-109]